MTAVDFSGTVALVAVGLLTLNLLFGLLLSIGYNPNWAGKHLNLEARVFNVFNTQRVTEYNETSQFGSPLAPQSDLNFGNVVNYQQARSVEFSARYEF